MDECYWENKDVSKWKTHIKEHTRIMRCFNTHRGFLQSEEDEFMWIHSKFNSTPLIVL